jgi:phosphinothricin acetyltransferase
LPDWEKWDSGHHKNCRLIALEPRDEAIAEILIPLDGVRVLGWAALSPVSSRRVYAGVAEVSLYVAAAARGRGVGKALLQTLVEESEKNGTPTASRCTTPADFARLASGTASASSAKPGEM